MCNAKALCQKEALGPYFDFMLDPDTSIGKYLAFDRPRRTLSAKRAVLSDPSRIVFIDFEMHLRRWLKASSEVIISITVSCCSYYSQGTSIVSYL
jgi:hypothetical protein